MLKSLQILKRRIRDSKVLIKLNWLYIDIALMSLLFNIVNIMLYESTTIVNNNNTNNITSHNVICTFCRAYET
jgi:hypothetical protein